MDSRKSWGAAVALSAVAVAAFGTPGAWAAAVQPPGVAVAANALGDLSAFRAIAADTLRIVEAGDLSAAKDRIRDLETTWDDAEATLRPRHKTAWRKIDKAIDAALAELRAPGPNAARCASSLRDLLGSIDAVANQA